jgi:hypothetical protein
LNSYQLFRRQARGAESFWFQFIDFLHQLDTRERIIVSEERRTVEYQRYELARWSATHMVEERLGHLLQKVFELG